MRIRQVKALAPILDGTPLSPELLEMERFITFNLMISLEADVASSCTDMLRCCFRSMGCCPGCLLVCFAPCIICCISHKIRGRGLVRGRRGRGHSLVPFLPFVY